MVAPLALGSLAGSYFGGKEVALRVSPLISTLACMHDGVVAPLKSCMRTYPSKPFRHPQNQKHGSLTRHQTHTQVPEEALKYGFGVMMIVLGAKTFAAAGPLRAAATVAKAAGGKK